MKKKNHLSIFSNILFGITVISFTTIYVQANIENCNMVYEVTASQLNVRADAKKTSTILDTIYKGKKVCVENVLGQWAFINLGWVSSKYLIKVNNIGNQKTIDTTTANSSTEDNNILWVLMSFFVVFYILKTLFYKTITKLGLAKIDRRGRNGVVFTRSGNIVSRIFRGAFNSLD